MSSEDKSPVSQMWFEEVHKGYLKTGFLVEKTLFSEKSEFQQLDIVETRGHGKMLFNDGLAMVSERDEFIYHEMIAHVPLFVHPNPRRVLVIGGGDGGTVREVIRHKSVEFCKLVEIDGLVVEGCKKHIPLTSAALGDPRVEVVIDDGVKYMAETEDRYDVILVDSTDPIGPAAPLFGTEFYGNVRSVLADDGIVVSQCESPFYLQDEQFAMISLLSKLFVRTHIFNFVNMTYPGGLWSFSFASKGLCPVGDFDSRRVQAANLRCSWYNQDIHTAAFQLPEFQKRKLQGFLTPFKARHV